MRPRTSRSSSKPRCRRWRSRPQQSKQPRRPPRLRRLLPAAPANDLTSQLQQLATLKEQGILSDEEFAAAKAKLLSGG